MGQRHSRALGGALQPNFLPYRLGLVARQRTDRARPVAIWPEGRGPASLHRPFPGGKPLGATTTARVVLRLCTPAHRPDPIPRRLCTAGLGKCLRLCSGGGLPRLEIRPRGWGASLELPEAAGVPGTCPIARVAA